MLQVCRVRLFIMEAAFAPFIPPKLRLDQGSAAFILWKKKWKTFATISKLDKESADYRVSMLTSCLDDDGLQVVETLDLSEDDQKSVEAVIAALEKYVQGEVNVTMERHLFRNRRQEDGESFKDFLMDLKLLLKTCDFCVACHDGILVDGIIEGIRSDDVKRRLLGVKNLDLKRALEICQQDESSSKRLEVLNSGRDRFINKIGKQERVTHNTYEKRGAVPREKPAREAGYQFSVLVLSQISSEGKRLLPGVWESLSSMWAA